MRTLTTIAPPVRIQIYALVEPGTESSPDVYVRYIGQTKRPLFVRVSQHIQDAKLGRTGNDALRTWILGLLKWKRRPVILPLQPFCASQEEADRAEQRFIQAYASAFPDLLNLRGNARRRQSNPFTERYLKSVGAA